MINRERRNNYGLNTNVDVSPESTSQSNPSINNIIINSNDKIPERNPEINNPYPNIPSTIQSNLPSNNKLPSTFNVDVQTRDININPSENYEPYETLESKLLEIYTDILLSNNKVLLSNIISKKSIILSKYDLEIIIGFVTKLACKITLVPDEVSCIVKTSPIKPISSIKLIDGKNNYDFQTIFNSTYNELCDRYSLNLTHCI